MTNGAMIRGSELSALGPGEIDADHLDRLVASCLDVDQVVVTDVRVVPVEYEIGTIATESLDRVQGGAITPDGRSRGFSIFVKQLRSSRLWPFIDMIPASMRDHWISDFPWRIEIDAFSSPLADVLPDGMRMARLFDVVEVDPDRATIWMEDVATDPGRRWTTADYLRAARLLGELAGRRPVGSDTALGLASNHAPGIALTLYARGRIVHQSIPAIHADDTWSARRLDGDDLAELRARLRRATAELDALLARLEALPHVFAHGDASPQNLLQPIGDENTFVVIDWGFNSPQAVGFDLGQLLLGLANIDELDPGGVRELEPQVIDAYTEGLLAAGFAATRDEVREGYAVSTVVRSLFTALGLDEGPAGADWTDEHRHNRIEMTRHLLDLCEEYA